MRKKLPPHSAMGLVTVLFLLAVTRPSLTQALQGPVVNPGFDEGSNEVKPGYGGKGSLADGSWEFFLIQAPSEGVLDAAQKHSGQRSYRFDNGAGGRGFLHSKPFSVKPGARYHLSAWVKTEGAPEKGVLARVFWFTREGPGAPCADKELDDTEPAPGTTDWKQLSAIVTSPKDAAMAYIRLETNDGAVGVAKPPFPLALKTDKPFKVWFDGVEFVPAP